jgi:putative ATPase
MELFPDLKISSSDSPPAPLADRMRPSQIKDFLGHPKLMGEGKPLRKIILGKSNLSFILWGPPGSGKTTVARLAANISESNFNEISAVNSGVADIRQVIKRAKKAWRISKKTSILFIDEIHRLNKSQQDSILPDIEDGTIRLIGSTTENPSFEVISSLRSRCQIFRLESLSQQDISSLLELGLTDKERGLGNESFEINSDAKRLIVTYANGDARKAFNLLEAARDFSLSLEKDSISIKVHDIEAIIQEFNVMYDKGGTEHYDHASAFQKSMRGSDPDAAIYWLAKMIGGGEDPRFIARRILVTASEDVGNADPMALVIASAAAAATEKLGWPEARIPLAQAVIYVSQAPKDNSVILAVDSALNDIKHNGKSFPVPDHLKDTHYKDAKLKHGYGKEYKYPHDYPNHKVDQEYLPEALKGVKYILTDQNKSENKS